MAIFLTTNTQDIIKVAFKKFPCGEVVPEIDPFTFPSRVTLRWESDEDLIHLMLFKKYYPKHEHLTIMYMPYARMDRDSNGGSSCSLRWIAEFIKGLGWKDIAVIDPHSDLTLAYLGEQSRSIYPFTALPGNYDLIMFPDAGAQKRYGSMPLFKSHQQIVGNKVRDFQTGKITGYSLNAGDKALSNKKILIVDDLCSYGGTFMQAGEALKAIGAASVDLMVSHCEYSIFDGKIFKEGSPINHVYTTDSLLPTKEHWPINSDRLFQLPLFKYFK